MKTFEQIVEERAEELEGKWVALVLEKCTVPLPIPEGILESGTFTSAFHENQLTGFEVLCRVRHSQECVGEKKRNGVKTVMILITASEPFVIKWYEYTCSPLNIQVIKPQQVSKGELGSFPRVPMPRFTRGAMSWGWVRLTNLASHLNMSPSGVWSEYYEIGRDVSPDKGMTVCIDGCGRKIQVTHLNGMRRLFQYGSCSEEYECSRIWVSAGWATDACYFRHFYKQRVKAAGSRA